MPPRRRTRPASPTRSSTDAGTTTRVAFYRRASTDEGNQPYSLDAQDQRLRPYVAAQPGWQVTGDYVERASGKDVENRPELQRLLADAAAGKFDMVLVARIDRWSRSLIDLLDTVDHLDAHGVGFHSATEHFDTNTPLGRLLLQMLGMFAEFERSMIIDRIQRGNAAKIASGIPLNSNVGYGLTVTDTGVVAADPATIGVVKRIFREYVHHGKGIRAIAVGLNDDGISGPGTRGWSPQSVSRILRNRALVGEVSHRGTWHPGAHEPLIDVDLFHSAQTLADRRAENAAASATRRGDFVLTGTIRCAYCGSAYVGNSGTSKTGAVKRYYSCGTARRYGAKQCTAPTLPADELETLITESLLACYTDTALFDEAIAAHLAAHADRHQPLTEELHTVTTTLADKERVLARYQADYEAGKLSAERYEGRAAELSDEVLALTARAAELQFQLEGPALTAAPTAAELAEMRTHLLAGIRGGNAEVRKDVFAALVESIIVHARDDIRPTYRLYDPGTAPPALTAPDVNAAAGSRANGGDDSGDDNAPATTEVDTGAVKVSHERDGLAFASRHVGWWPRESNPGWDDNVVVGLDVESDGDADFVVGSLDGPDRLLVNDGSGRLTLADEVFDGTPGRGTLGMVIADLDGDGRPDVVEAQGEAEDSEDERVWFGTDVLAPDTAPPVIRAEIVGRTVLARVHDNRTTDQDYEWRSVVARWAGGRQPLQWYGEHLFRAEIPTAVRTVEVCATDAAGNTTCETTG